MSAPFFYSVKSQFIVIEHEPILLHLNETVIEQNPIHQIKNILSNAKSTDENYQFNFLIF